jgi:large subunit ribosomal protein L23
VSTVHGKMRRWKRWTARRPDWKKAIVTLKAGDKLDLFEL